MNVIIMPHGKSELVERFCKEKSLIVDIGRARFPSHVLPHTNGIYMTSPFEYLADVDDDDEISEIKQFKHVIFYSYDRYSENVMSVERIAGALDGWSDVTFMFNSI